MRKKKSCRFCGKPLDEEAHGNSEHCDGDCSYAHRLIRQGVKYREHVQGAAIFKKVEQILKWFHDQNGSEKAISAQSLDDAGMDWDISEGTVTIGEDLAIKIINYAYCLNDDETIQIWKL